MSLNTPAWPPFRRPEDDPVLWLHLNGGGKIACFGETVRKPSGGLPWLVMHGGPGGRINASLVASLRRASLRWLGMDQRCSGLSEDLHLEDVDTQRLIDDQIALLDHLHLDKVRILAGSWGATLALAMATQRPDRIESMVLRNPFLPFRQRVDEFFQRLRLVNESTFDSVFSTADVTGVCGLFESNVPDSFQLKAAHIWSALEAGLLSGAVGSTVSEPPGAGTPKAEALLRKYRLQAYFLRHDCFWSKPDIEADMQKLDASSIPISIVQGENDRVCPPDGAQWLSQRLASASLVFVPKAGHLADDSNLARVIESEVRRHSGV